MALAELLLASLRPEGLTDPTARSQVAMVAQILREFKIETAHELTEALHRAGPVKNEGELSRLRLVLNRFSFPFSNAPDKER